MNFSEFFASETFKNLLIVLAIIIAIIFVLNLFKTEGFDATTDGIVVNEQIDNANDVTGIVENTTAESVDVEENDTKLSNVPLNQTTLPYPQPSNGYDVKTLENETLIAEDLKPHSDPTNIWNAVNPDVPGTFEDRNFLDAGYHIGIDTQLGSLKLKYHDIRSLPPIPRVKVGPWNQSTYDPYDINRREFEIGGAMTSLEEIENLPEQ